MSKLLKLIFSRMGLVVLLIAAQFVFLLMLIWKISNYFIYFYFFSLALSIAVMIYILGRRDNPSYKLAWAMPILLFPMFGGLCYVIFGHKAMPRRKRLLGERLDKKTRDALHQDVPVSDELMACSKAACNQSRYIYGGSGYPAYRNTGAIFLPLGEDKFSRLKEELERAEHYIFLEYFIIQEGVMWDAVLEILCRKVSEGVDVRVIYDDIGCLRLLPYGYYRKLRKMGIKCQVFNEFKPYLTIRFNNRDHRKLAIIDGLVGFTGGINLADEYINAYDKLGHWKDSSIMICGEAVWSMTMMFLETWSFCTRVDEDILRYKPEYHATGFDGYIQPYGDSPNDEEALGENIYLSILGHARDYIYITTPYLIVGSELATALALAAKSGVDVRIITPHHADKWYVHIVTQSYYPMLIEAGVKIYEYTPGFIHSKTFVCDDEVATVGTINMDFRSLYLHFECGVWMYKTSAVADIRDDFLKTQALSQRITKEDCRNIPLIKRIIRAVLRIFAPLM
ncbi:MAG: cardiolipin synthase [Clostridia bacterium]